MRAGLLVRLGGLGDVLIALPALRLVRAAFPGARLRLMARPDCGALLREAGVVDAASAPDDPAWMPLFDPALSPTPEFRAELAGADALLGWFHAGGGPPAWWRDPWPAGFASGAGPRPAGRAFLYEGGSGAPISRAFFDRTAEFVRADGRPAADFAACALLFADRSPRREGFAVVHPGSGGARKRWPLARFRTVIEALADGGLDGLLVTGEAEAALEEDVAAMPLPRGWRRVVRPALAGLADALRRAAVYVGNDSGVTHLAAACGAPTIAVFRDEFAAAWRPFGPATVLSAASPDGVAAADVIRAIAGILR